MGTFSTSGVDTPSSTGATTPRAAWDHGVQEGFHFKRARVATTVEAIKNDSLIRQQCKNLGCDRPIRYFFKQVTPLLDATEAIRQGRTFDEVMRKSGFDYAIKGQSVLRPDQFDPSRFVDYQEPNFRTPELRHLQDALRTLRDISDQHSTDPGARDAACGHVLATFESDLTKSLGPASAVARWQTGRNLRDRSGGNSLEPILRAIEESRPLFPPGFTTHAEPAGSA